MRTATMMLTTVLVLGSASLASAECAWVLWQKKIHNRAAEWSVVKASASRASCDQLKLAEWRGWSEILGEHEGTERVEGESLTVCAPSGCSSREWLCLPDTIDPREKK